MEWVVYFILIILGYIIFRSFSSSKSQPGVVDSGYEHRKTGRGVDYTRDREKESLIQSAKRQERLNNYDEASRLYLNAGQVFSAAKMKAMKGPNSISEALEIIQINSSDRVELVTRNLANEFFYRLEQPATSAALLRGIGLHDEAEAVEVAAGIAVQRTQSQPIETRSAVVEETEEQVEVVFDQVPVQEPIHEIDQASGEEVIPEEIAAPASTGSYPNSMMMASTVLDDPCSVCKREIKAGDSFIYCLNCGKPGHYGHLGEMIKVTGICPICKNRLTPTMYEI